MSFIGRSTPGRTALAVDVGGTKLDAALVLEDGSVIREKRIATPKENGAFHRALGELIIELCRGVSVSGCGFSVPGSIDPKSGRLRNAPNSPEINQTLLVRDLAAYAPAPVFVANDADCLALSEFVFGAGRGEDPLLALILGTGVGAGLVVSGRLFQGSGGLAPEVGHMPLEVHGRLCLCGNRGCVEAYLSGPSMLRRYHEAGGSPSLQDTRDLFTATEDPVARAVLEETRYLFARFIAAMVSVYNPGLILLGGGLSRQPFYYEAASQIAAYQFGTRDPVPVRPAAGGDSSGRLGAASLVFSQGGLVPASS